MARTVRLVLGREEREFLACLAGSTDFVLVVGGAVRDAIRGVESVDLDLVTSASAALIKSVAEKCPAARSSYAVGERFGTIGVVLNSGRDLEVSTVRASSEGDAGERFSADAGHRDFTVNAMAVDTANDLLLDPTGGCEDLAARMLRAPGDPSERFAEDPLRVIRAGRFVSELGFDIDAATEAALGSATGSLKRVAVERVRDEVTKLLLGAHPDLGLRVMLDCGALAAVLPEVAAMAGVTQPSFHDLDVFDHTAQAVRLAPHGLVMRWAALLHDIGKPTVRTVEAGGRIRFFRHAEVGAEMASEVCRRLRFSNDETAAIVHLVGQHMRLGEVNVENPASVDRAVRKLDLWAGAGDGARLIASAEDAVGLTVADFSATAHRAEAPRVRQALDAAVGAARERLGRVRIAPPISGADVMDRFGVPEGPLVGRALSAVSDAIEAGELERDDRDGAFRIAEGALGETR